MPKEKGQGLVEYALVLVLVSFFIMVAWALKEILHVNAFDKNFDNHTTIINSVAIPIGTASVTNPAPTSILDIPSVKGEGLNDHPRSWNLDICTEVSLKAGATTLYAAAPKDVASLILIQMPIAGGKTIIVCGPVGVQTKIFLWTD